MSIRIMTIVWQLDLSSSDKIVLLALADNASDEGICWPSIATISKKCSVTERTVQRSIGRLVSSGHVTRNEVYGKGCKYNIHPRHSVTPDTVSPPTQCHPTPDTVSPKPSITVNTNKPKGLSVTRARENPFPKPDFIGQDVWQDFLTNRKKKKTPNTATAYKKLISDLERWQKITGWTMENILVRCTAKGWAAIYDPRDENEKQQRDNIQTSGSGRDKRSGLAKAIDGHLGAENPFI